MTSTFVANSRPYAFQLSTNGFYETPWECTVGLMQNEILPPHIWEPCCGKGAIATVLEDAGYQVTSTDLVDRGYGISDYDFLTASELVAPAIVTNPPFAIADKIILHARALGVGYLALLLKATYWHNKRRRALFEAFTPSRIHALAWRPDFTGQDKPTMDCIWCVWDGADRSGRYLVMPRPTLQLPNRPG